MCRAVVLLLLNSLDCQRNQEKSQLFQAREATLSVWERAVFEKKLYYFRKNPPATTVGLYGKDTDNQYITQKPPNLPTYQPTENRIFFCYLFLNDYMISYLYILL